MALVSELKEHIRTDADQSVRSGSIASSKSQNSAKKAFATEAPVRKTKISARETAYHHRHLGGGGASVSLGQSLSDFVAQFRPLVSWFKRRLG